ncbi:hypothetical protein NPN27_21440 [Stutzerimonas stutzeri]|uniref:hypothetical protein n=1 Tax=Stutzerimonas stutzeri TaxID=316 RepID=UPI0021114CA4|nr:hypothetical protein [Stutzerimonas stutzeri]UUC83462.1 hypothetical protein NPN27_21440 [Stutzerimonas stutzeri]
MAAIDFLKNQGFSVKAQGGRLIVSPSSKLTPDVRQYIKRNRLVLIAEAAANDGELRRTAWDVLTPCGRKSRMVGQPMTYTEALATARGRWPGAEILEN